MIPLTAVLTVTCERDRWAFERQYILMARLCMPTDWHIVINEIDSDAWVEWFTQLRRGIPCNLNITVHTMQSMPLCERLCLFNGYWRQQFYKMFLTASLSYDVVVVLDSKNWLVRPWHPLMHKVKPRRAMSDEWAHFHRTKNFCEMTWGKNKVPTRLPNLTRGVLPPVSWDPKQVNAILDHYKGADTFLDYVVLFWKFTPPDEYCDVYRFNSDDTISEFLMYDFWSQHKHLPDLLPQETPDNCNYNNAIKWEWDNFNWHAFDQVFKENSTYWITIKWHTEPVDHLKTRIWTVVEQKTSAFETTGWKLSAPNTNS